MNFFKSLFWWAWVDDEDRQRVQTNRQKVQQPAQHKTGEAHGNGVEDFDDHEYEEFFND